MRIKRGSVAIVRVVGTGLAPGNNVVYLLFYDIIPPCQAPYTVYIFTLYIVFHRYSDSKIRFPRDFDTAGEIRSRRSPYL